MRVCGEGDAQALVGDAEVSLRGVLGSDPYRRIDPGEESGEECVLPLPDLLEISDGYPVGTQGVPQHVDDRLPRDAIEVHPIQPLLEGQRPALLDQLQVVRLQEGCLRPEVHDHPGVTVSQDRGKGGHPGCRFRVEVVAGGEMGPPEGVLVGGDDVPRPLLGSLLVQSLRQQPGLVDQGLAPADESVGVTTADDPNAERLELIRLVPHVLLDQRRPGLVRADVHGDLDGHVTPRGADDRGMIGPGPGSRSGGGSAIRWATTGFF